MAGLEMHQYRRLSNAGEDSDSTDKNTELPPLLKRVLDTHEYTMQKELGQGVSGRVFLVNNKDGDPYVIKQMNSRDKRCHLAIAIKKLLLLYHTHTHTHTHDNCSFQAKELVTVQKEVKILETLNHGYIVSYVESFKDEEAGLFYIVTEYCEGADLFKRMQTQKKKGFFKEHQIHDWLVQICLALQYLHENNVLHRDIKPQNVFLTEGDYINLGDFGCSKVLERADFYAESVVGAELYASPEVHKKKYNYKSDIWSLGWLLYDLCMLDVWSDIEERRFQQASHNKGYPLHISEIYSEELRELIRQMLSRDPKHRPSADEILAKPFLNDAVKRNQRIPESLERKFLVSFNTFDEAYNNHYACFEALVTKWGQSTTSLEEVHHKCTAGALSGSVIGAAGGITALVGAILAPFTFGASLIVTGVGIGVGVAGGVTGAASSITNAVKQKSLLDNLENIKKNYENVSEPVLNPLNTLRKVLRKITKFRDFVTNTNFGNVQTSCSVDKTKIVWATELMNLGLLANLSRTAAQTAKAGRVAAAAVSGVISGLLVIVDIAFIVKDSVDIHQMRQGNIDDPEKIKSSALKSITQMRKTHNNLLNVLKAIKDTRECAVEITNLQRAYGQGDRE